ncbi:MAG: AAA family ATPase [Bacteroidales bacterium]|nr:AAA family ATPase [Bacteroidales bacterium]
MQYIKKLIIPNRYKDDGFFVGDNRGQVYGKDAITNEIIHYTDYNVFRTCYSTIYPFGVFREKGGPPINFDDITLFCGSNGSGKSTLLNVISEKLKLERMSAYNLTVFMKPFVDMTDIELSESSKYDFDPQSMGRIITSNDVFNHMLLSREKNERMGFVRERMFSKIAEYKQTGNIPREIDFDNPESIQEFNRHHDARSMSQSKYIKKHLGMDEKLYSNGESGFLYFTDAIQPNGLYLLDEPENSLSVQFQIKLAEYIELMARFYNCQFVISTHSVFMQSIHNALVYDLDAIPVTTTEWTKLPNVRHYYDFFKQRESEFK